MTSLPFTLYLSQQQSNKTTAQQQTKIFRQSFVNAILVCLKPRFPLHFSIIPLNFGTIIFPFPPSSFQVEETEDPVEGSSFGDRLFEKYGAFKEDDILTYQKHCMKLEILKKEDLSLTKSKLDELVESRSEISTRIQSLKQDLQNWRSKLETQVKSHREELTELRKSLDVEVTQLKSEFQELRTTLQQQQEDVTASLRNLGLQDPPNEAQTTLAPQDDDDTSSTEAKQLESSNGKNTYEDSTIDREETEIVVSATSNLGEQNDHNIV